MVMDKTHTHIATHWTTANGFIGWRRKHTRVVLVEPAATDKPSCDLIWWSRAKRVNRRVRRYDAMACVIVFVLALAERNALNYYYYYCPQWCILHMGWLSSRTNCARKRFVRHQRHTCNFFISVHACNGCVWHFICCTHMRLYNATNLSVCKCVG